MAAIEHGRMTADHRGPLAVFVIGMRINRPLAVRRWWPVFRAMGGMRKELSADRASGFLGAQTSFASWRVPVMTQYWASFDQLHTYAHDPARMHRPAWRRFNREVGGDGSVGIYHDTYVVAAGAHETMYVNMIPFGLGSVAGRVPATGSRQTAHDRLVAGQAASGTGSVRSIQPPPSTRSPS